MQPNPTTNLKVLEKQPVSLLAAAQQLQNALKYVSHNQINHWVCRVVLGGFGPALSCTDYSQLAAIEDVRILLVALTNCLNDKHYTSVHEVVEQLAMVFEDTEVKSQAPDLCFVLLHGFGLSVPNEYKNILCPKILAKHLVEYFKLDLTP